MSSKADKDARERGRDSEGTVTLWDKSWGFCQKMKAPGPGG